MTKRMRRGLITALLLAGGVVIGVSLLVSRGFSARGQPTRLEAFVARRMRGLSIPSEAKNLKNPVALDEEVLRTGLSHFADHCAVCHANNGSGETPIGLNLYPKSPDMRLSDTQSLTDGELFYIIENGVRFTGMPAWGGGNPESAHDSWALVHFIRRLPKLTAAELKEMEGLNPKTIEQLREEEEMRRFLEGDEAEEKPKSVFEKSSPHKH